MNIMRDRYYFAAYSGGECILKCQGTDMTITSTDNRIYVDYIDDDGKHQQVMLSPNSVWTVERGS